MCIRDSYDTPPEPKSAETPGHRIQSSSACRSSTQRDATEWLPKWAGSVSNSGQVQVSVITLFAVQPALAVRVEEQLRVGVLAGRAVLPSSQLGHRSRPSVPRHEASYRPDCPAVSPRLTLLLDPADRVHRRGHAEALQYPPHRCDVAERPVLAALRCAGGGAGEPAQYLLRGAQVLLVDDPRLSLNPGRLHQVVVRPVTPALAHDRRHIWAIHLQHRSVDHRHAVSDTETPTTAGRLSA